MGVKTRGAMLGAALIALSLAIWAMTGPSRVDFDADAWKSWTETEQSLSLRWDMVGDLLTRHRLQGMARAEIIALLGPPSSETPTRMVYYLGMSRNGINSGRLTLELDPDAQVTKALVSEG